MENKQDKPEVQNLINKSICNPQGLEAFINNENELIVSPILNAYFRLEDVETELDFKCKCLEWLSYFVSDNHWFGNHKERKKIESFINYILGTDIKHSEFQLIYMRLGNRINHDLTVKFVKSNYDIKVLERKTKNE